MKTRQNQASALISNFATAEKALNSALNSTGVAVNENKIYLDSIQGRLATLKATAQGFANDIIDPNWIKWVVTLGDYLVRGFDFIMTIDDKAFKGLIDFLSEQTSGLKELQDVFLLPELSDRFKMLEKYVEIFGKIPSLIGAITAALTIARKQTAILPSNIVADKKKERTYNKPLIGNVDKSVFDNFNENVFNNGNSDEYKRLLGYVSESQPTFGKAKDSLDDYLSSCIKLNEEANPENYKKFIQEKAQENYGGFFGLLRFNEDYNKLRQSEQPEVTPAVDSNTLQDEIQDVMENSAETSEQFFEEMIARATENGTEEQEKATIRRYKRKNRQERRAKERNVSTNVFAAPDEVTGQISRPVNRRSRAFEFSDAQQLIESLDIDQEQIDRAEASLPPLTLEFRGQIDDQQIQEATQDVQEAAESAANNSEDSGIVDTLIESGTEAMDEVTLETAEESSEQLADLQEGIAQVNEQSQDTQDNMNSVAAQTNNATRAQQGMIDAISQLHPQYAAWRNQNPDGNMLKYAAQLAQVKAKQFLAQAGQAAFNAVVSWGISAVITGFTSQIAAALNYYNDLREANLETMKSFEDTASAIDDYKEKIEELYKVMNDESSTTNEVYDAKSNLLDIQRELIDTYGDQARSIDLVNGELEKEKKLLDDIERKKAEDTYNSTVSSYEDSKEKLEKEHGAVLRNGNYSLSSGLFGKFGDGNISELMKSDISEQIKQLGFDVKFGDLVFDKKVSTKEAIEKYNELINLIEKSDNISQENATALKEAISDNINNLNSEKYQSWLTDVENTSWAAIRKDEKLYGKYTDIEDAINEYDEALKNGDKAGAEKQLEVITELQKKMETMKFDDEYIKQHFVDLFDDIQNDLDKREFKIKITQKDDKFNSRFLGMGNRATSTNDYFRTMFKDYSDVDIERIRLSGGTAKEEEAYKKLTELADEYEISVDEAIDVLVELGIIFSRDADAAKYTTTNFSSMLEEVEKTTEGLDKFVSAQQKVATDSALTADEVNELIKLDGSLSSSVERTANGYVISSEKLAEARAKYINEQKESLKEDIAASEKQLENVKRELAVNQKIVDELGSKSDLTDDEKRKLNDAKAIVENRLEDEKATTEQLEQQKLLLGQIISPLEDYAAMFKDVADKAESVTDKLAQMRSGQYKTGVIDPTDVLDFINEVPDWQNYIEINNGKATLKDTSGEALKEQIKQTSGYYDVSEKLNDKLKERNELQDKINDFEANNVIDSPSEVKMLDDMNGELDILNGTIDISEKQFKALTAILDVFFGKIEKKQAITDFEDEISKLNHKKSLGMSEDAWAGEYATIANNYRNDLKALADDGDTDALSKLWEIDEQLYQNNIDATQRAFDAKKLIIDNAREDLQMSVLEYRDAYAALNEAYYAPGTSLGNTEGGKQQYAANLREIEKLSSEAYDNIISRFQSAIDFGKIIDPNIINDLADVFKGQELPDAVAQVIQKGIETGIWNATDLATIAPYLTEALLAGSDVNSEAYQNAINQQKDYVISAFEYEKTQLDNQLEAGLISSGDFIDEYTKLWEKYYKDKKEFAEEDLQTQKDILEAHKSEIQKQIDALEAYSENQTEPYQNEIDALNDVKDAYDDLMDDRIDALEEEKKAIEKKNEEQEEANDLQEKWLNLQKASMNKRLVYMGNGGWQLKRDEEEYNNAKKEYDEAKKEDATAKIDEAIEKLEEEKEARDKAIDKDIEAREDAIKRIQKPIDDLTKVLTLLVTEQQNIDPEFIAQLLNTESADEALALINKKNSFGQEQEAKYGVDANYDQLTTETINKLAKEAEKRNQTLDEYAKSLGLNLSETVTNANQNTIDKLLDEYNKLVSDRKSKGSDYGEVGHTGKVDYNNRPINLNEDDYNTLLGTTLSYESIANMFDEYLKSNNIESEELWNICEALWDIVETNENMHFNVSPLRPDGTAVTDLNADDDQFFDGIYDYILSQLASGIRLEDMDIFMGGNYASGDEADQAAQRAHEDSAKMYDQEVEILKQLVALGYDVNQLDGVKYTGEIPTQPETKDNTKSTDANTDAIKENTKAVEKGAATTADTTADATETNKNLDANSYLIDSNGEQVLNDGKPIKALTHDEWAKKHKVSEWATPGRSVNENMTMEQYETLKKGQKNGIIPASIVDIADITDAQLKQFLGAIQSNTKIAPQNVNTAMKPIADIANEAIQTYNNSPIINFSVQVDGSADEKTIQAMETKIGNMLINYTDKLTSSIATSSLRRQNKS